MTFLDWFNAHHHEYQAVLFDVDGTLALGAKPLPGNRELISRLTELSFPYFMLTNDPGRSHERKCRQLARAGLDIPPSAIISSGDVLVNIVPQFDLAGKRVFMLGHAESYAEGAGLIPVTDPAMIEGCQAVLVADEKYDWYTCIQAAINFLNLNRSLPLIVMNPDGHWTSMTNGEIGVGAGGIGRFILDILRDMDHVPENVFLGKPYPDVYHYTTDLLKKSFGLPQIDPARIIAVGDALFSDIRGANEFGMTSVLLLTGVTSREMAEKATGTSRPDLIFETLA